MSAMPFFCFIAKTLKVVTCRKTLRTQLLPSVVLTNSCLLFLQYKAALCLHKKLPNKQLLITVYLAGVKKMIFFKTHAGRVDSLFPVFAQQTFLSFLQTPSSSLIGTREKKG